MRTQSPTRFCLTASMLVLAAAGLGGCSNIVKGDITGSVAATPATPQSDADWRKVVDVYADRYQADPKDPEVAFRYGTALRATGQRAQSMAVLEQAAIGHPGNRALVAAYGRALVDNGNYQRGFDTLSRAHTPDNPDWHILSVQGTALDRLGRHEEARRYYANALKIRPGEPSVLSNLGMSYVLSKQLAKAEDALRRAHQGAQSDMRIRQNLALAIGLQGRLPEAESIVTAGLPPDQAAENASYLRQILKEDSSQPRAATARQAETSRSSRG